MADDIALKNCPFCGGEAIAKNKSFYRYPVWEVGCRNKHPWIFIRAIEREAAIAAWNTRAPDPLARAEAFEEAARWHEEQGRSARNNANRSLNKMHAALSTRATTHHDSATYCRAHAAEIRKGARGE